MNAVKRGKVKSRKVKIEGKPRRPLSVFAKVMQEVERSAFPKNVFENGSRVVLNMKGHMVEIRPALNTYLVISTGKSGTDAFGFIRAARRKFAFGCEAHSTTAEGFSPGRFHVRGFL